MSDQTIEVTDDTFLDQGAATTNRNSINWIQFRVGGSEDTAVFRFNISTLVKKDWDSVTLNLTYRLSPAPISNGVSLYVSYVLQSIVYSQTTWTIYASSSNWATAGAKNVLDNDHSTRALWDLTGSHSSGETVVSPDITDIVRKAVIEDGTFLDIIMYGEGGSGTPAWQWDSIRSLSAHTPAFLLVTSVDDMETTTSSNPGGTATNVAVPSASSLSKSGRPPIAGADRQNSVSILHDGVEPMNILSITLRGTYGADN